MKNKKAKKGDKCTNCGFCCTNEVCDIGLSALPSAKPPCPFLLEEYDHKSDKIKLLCPFVVIEKQLSKKLTSEALGIGKGCCSDDFG